MNNWAINLIYHKHKFTLMAKSMYLCWLYYALPTTAVTIISADGYPEVLITQGKWDKNLDNGTPGASHQTYVLIITILLLFGPFTNTPIQSLLTFKQILMI